MALVWRLLPHLFSEIGQSFGRLGIFLCFCLFVSCLKLQEEKSRVLSECNMVQSIQFPFIFFMFIILSYLRSIKPLISLSQLKVISYLFSYESSDGDTYHQSDTFPTWGVGYARNTLMNLVVNRECCPRTFIFQYTKLRTLNLNLI